MSYILIVDDDPDIVHAVSTVLRKENYEVESVSDFDSAIQSIEKRPPDLLLLDLMFPDNRTAGFDIARKIRSDANGKKKFPIIMMSSINQLYPFQFSSKDIDDEWMPVTEYLDKPINFDTLKSKVSELLKA